MLRWLSLGYLCFAAVSSGESSLPESRKELPRIDRRGIQGFDLSRSNEEAMRHLKMRLKKYNKDGIELRSQKKDLQLYYRDQKCYHETGEYGQSFEQNGPLNRLLFLERERR